MSSSNEVVERNVGQGNEHGGGKDHPKQDKDVKVTVDSNKVKVAPGIYTVSDFKAAVGVPAEKELDIVIDGQFTPLADDAKIDIKGGEEFISHVRAGGSS